MRSLLTIFNYPIVGFWLVVFSNMNLLTFKGDGVVGILVPTTVVWSVLTFATLLYSTTISRLVSVGCIVTAPVMIVAAIMVLVIPEFIPYGYEIHIPNLYYLSVMGFLVGMIRLPDYLIYRPIQRR